MDKESRLYQSHDTNRFDRGGRKSYPRSDDREALMYPKGSNFTLLQHDVYGNCYTFQSDRLHISKSGPGSGLTMVLYMEKEEYLQQINEGYGARVLIHDSKTFPFREEEGFYVASAAETQIGIKMVEIERHGTPYGECVTGDGYEARYGFKYTRPINPYTLAKNYKEASGCCR